MASTTTHPSDTEPAPPTKLSDTLTDASNGSFQEAVLETEAALNELELARRFVPHIIANAGVIVDRDGGWSDAAIYLGETQQAKRELEAIETVLQAMTHLAPPVDGRTWDTILHGAVYGYADEQRRAAYLLGIAVGQQLGPDAFKTGGANESLRHG